MTNIFKREIQAFNLIHATIVVFIGLCVMLQYIVDCVFRMKSYSKLRVFEYFIFVLLLYRNM
jgi:hypothetical protein